MSDSLQWTYLSLGGFLLGVFFYTGWYTVKFEPAVRWGYLVVGLGIFVSVLTSAIVNFHYREISDVYASITLFSYVVIAAGLALILRARRRE